MTTTWTTFRTGRDPDEIRYYTTAAAYLDAWPQIGDHRVVGGGSNLLVSDDGPAGSIVVLTSDRAAACDRDGDRVRIDAAGNWSETVAELGRQGLAGVESLIGIPGSVGGACVQNIGAYGTEIAERIEKVETIDASTGDVVHFDVTQCRFAYRDSRFKTADRGRYVVTAVVLRLVPDGLHQPRYAELARELESRFGRHDDGYTIDQVHHVVLELRRRKNMVWDKQDTRTWGAGSFFVNPIVAPSVFEAAQATSDATIPAWPIETTGQVKLAAGWLVEQSGFRRGHSWARVALADGHALGLVNRSGEASSLDVLEAANAVASAVHERFAIRLHAEPVLMGFDPAVELAFDAIIER